MPLDSLAADFLSADLLWCVKTLFEPVIFGGGAGFLLSQGVKVSAVLDRSCCVPVVTRLNVDA